MNVREKYAEWVGPEIALERPLTDKEVEVIEAAREYWNTEDAFVKWFRQTCETTIPMLGNTYMHRTAQFTPPAGANEMVQGTTFFAIIDTRLFGVVRVFTIGNTGDRLQFDVSVSPIGFFLSGMCHKEATPADSLDILVKRVRKDESPIHVGRITDRVYSDQFVLTCRCRRKPREGSEERNEERNERKVEDEVEEEVEHQEDEEEEEKVEEEEEDRVEIEGMDLSGVEDDTLEIRTQRVVEMFKTVTGWSQPVPGSVTKLASLSLKVPVPAFFQWFAAALQVHKRMIRFVLGQKYMYTFQTRSQSILFARTHNVSTIRSSNSNPNLLTVFTPLPDRRIREWWVQYCPETKKFAYRDHRVDHISELFTA